MMPRDRTGGTAVGILRRVKHRDARRAPRLAPVFNIQGGEMIFLLLVALVILGPEKLPDAVRKFTKAYTEFRKMASGFQGELKQVLDEPMRELRETADAMRDAAKFDIDPEVTGGLSNLGGGSPGTKPATARMQPVSSDIEPKTASPNRKDGGLNFGGAAARRQSRNTADPETADREEAAADAADVPVEAPVAEDTTE